MRWALRQAQLHRQEDEPEHPDLLADHQTQGHAERHGIEQHVAVDPGERDARVGEPEDRQDQERRPRVDRMFEVVQERLGSSGLPGLARSGIVSASSTPAIMAWMPDFSVQPARASAPSDYLSCTYHGTPSVERRLLVADG